MRSFTIANSLVIASILLPKLSLAVSLSDFQSITGFSVLCTAVYDSTIIGCTSDDFANGNSCSSDCISALETLQTALGKACSGERAESNTLIGEFFDGDGVSTLCPNIATKTTSSLSTSTSTSSSSSSSSTSTSSETSSTSTSTSTTTSTTSTSTSTTSSSTTLPAVVTTSETSTTTTSSQSSSTSSSKESTSTDAASSTLVISGHTTTSTSTAKTKGDDQSTKGFTTTIFNDGYASTITSKAQQTMAEKTNPEAFGGGGSPFEIGTDSASAVGIKISRRMWVWTIIGMIVGIVLGLGWP